MKWKFIIFVWLITSTMAGQTTLQPGDKAPSFLLNTGQGGLQSFSMPYMNKLVLLHFWSSTVSKSKAYNKSLNRLAGRYKSALYRKAEGFEIISIAVQSDKGAWAQSIKNDSLDNFTNGIANRGYSDDVCKKFGVTSVPTDILIDESGTIIAVNPHIRVLEDLLDERKSFLPVKKDVIGTLAMSSNPSDLLKFGRLYLFDIYGDSIARTVTTANGSFDFVDIKLNQDFILKVDNQMDIITSDPLALYSPKGEKLMEGKTYEGGFVFYIPSKMSFMLTEGEHSTLTGGIDQVDVVKDLVFKNGGAELTPNDMKEINSIVQILSKNKSLNVDVYAHTDSKLESKAAYELTGKQCGTVKNYIVKQGIQSARVRTSPKGSTQPRVKCGANCTEDDHKKNRRVEFMMYKG